MKGVKPGSVDGIVAIGGDGTMHEVLQVWTCAAVLLANRCRSDGGGQHQMPCWPARCKGSDGLRLRALAKHMQGMLARPDWQPLAALPFAQIPCGSGNALAASMGLWNVATAVHAIVKGQQRLLDIATGGCMMVAAMQHTYHCRPTRG